MQAEMEQNMADEMQDAARDKFIKWRRRGPDKKALAVAEFLEKDA